MSATPLRLAGLLLALATAPLVQASSDSSCQPSWRLDGRERDACSSLASLAPGNDSRVNLYWLLADQGVLQPQLLALDEFARSYGYGELPFAWQRLLPAADEVEYAENAEGLRPLDALDEELSGLLDHFDLTLEFPQRFATDPWPQGEGSRCRSNDRQTSRDFLQQLAGSAVPAAEQRQLARRRLQLLSAGCESAEQARSLLQPLDMQSAAGREFAAYLHGSIAFYAGEFALASQQFQQVTHSSQPWLAETADYLLGRTALNAAQRSVFDEWGFFDATGADTDALEQAGQGFNDYLVRWPAGRYAASARGLLRRVYWLQGRADSLAASYGQLFQQPLEREQVGDLLLEIDDKLLTRIGPATITQPLLLAVRDLMALREYDEAPLSLEQLVAQRPLFSAHPALHDYLLAAHAFFVRGDDPAVLQLLPASAAAPAGYLDFSRAMLRGLALQRSGQLEVARTHWQRLIAEVQQPLQREQAELALALNLQAAGQIDAAFSADSLIRSQPIRDRLLTRLAGAPLLREQVKADQPAEAQLALFMLLFRQLMHGDYQGFLDDLPRLQQMPASTGLQQRLGNHGYGVADTGLALFRWAGNQDGFACPPLADTVGRLAANPQDGEGLLCLGEFSRLNGLDDFGLMYRLPAGELGSGQTQFRGQPLRRMDAYLQVIDSAQASREQRAYALYRAIRCYAPSGYNHCGQQDIAQSQRKQWFTTLKRQYADSPWAQKLRYYW